jgi:hypothetical protein
VSSYYKRTVSLTAGKRGSETALKIGESRVHFSVKKTDKKSNNEAVVRIYNASKDTISTFDDDGAIVTLMAGYEQGLGSGVIFSGDVANINSERNGADIVTILELSEGSTVIREKSVKFSLGGTVSPVDVLNKIAGQIGVATSIPKDLSFKTYQSGFTAFGEPINAITKVCRKIKCNFSIENGVLNVWNNKKNGWSVKSLLNPTAMPGARIRVESNAITGNLRNINISHEGDTYGGEFITTVEGYIS